MRTKPRQSPTRAATRAAGAQLRLLSLGARLLQRRRPLAGFDAYLVGFHCVRDDPSHQMEAHHYCKVVGGDLLQCVLFDGNTRRANLIGIEYIVSERAFEALPSDEKDLWHPHNFEVLSGQLVAPGLPERAEQALARLLMNSYGKTWHTWHSGRHDGPTGDTLPVGAPALMWSFNREGECDRDLQEGRDRWFGIDSRAKHRQRQPLTRHAHPQRGVDAMAHQFQGTNSLDGVTDTARVAD